MKEFPLTVTDNLALLRSDFSTVLLGPFSSTHTFHMSYELRNFVTGEIGCPSLAMVSIEAPILPSCTLCKIDLTVTNTDNPGIRNVLVSNCALCTLPPDCRAFSKVPTLINCDLTANASKVKCVWF